MRLVVQRVKHAMVRVAGEVVGEIDQGVLVFLGIHKEDVLEGAPWLVNKLVNLRIFEDEAGKMNLSVKEIGGEVLVVSQFTLYGNCANGRRPDFISSMPGAQAEKIYEKFVREVENALGSVQAGRFGAEMEVTLLNDGPVTLILEGK